MANEIRRFGWTLGDNLDGVSEATASDTAHDDVVLDIKRATTLSKSDVAQAIECIKDKFLQATWPS